MDYQFFNILIRMPNWLGDFIMATPVVLELRRAYPLARISLLGKGSMRELAAADAYFDIDAPHLAQSLSGCHFDLGVLLTNSFSSAYLFHRAGIPALGYRGCWRSLLLDFPMKFSKKRASQHLVLTYKELLKGIGVSIGDSRPAVQIKGPPMLCKEGKRMIGINPQAAYGPAKCWPRPFFQETVRRLCDDPAIKVVIVGSGKIEAFDPRALNLIGHTDLAGLANALSCCDLFLTNDSGPMHMAAALGVPLLALFGSTAPEVTGPYGQEGVIRKKMACAPCFLKECPKDFACMRQITVDEVIGKIYGVLEKLPAQSQTQST